MIQDWDLDWGLELGIGDRDLGLGLETGDIYSGLELGILICTWDW